MKRVMWIVVIVIGVIGCDVIDDDGISYYYGRCTEGSILMEGDSITQRYNWQDLSDNDICIAAIHGSKTYNVIERFDADFALNHSKIILMIGTNDAAIKESLYDYSSRMKIIISKYIEYNIPIYILSVIPRGACCTTTENHNSRVEEYNNFLREYCNENDITFIDFYDAFKNSSDNLYVESSGGVHPNGKGYKIIIDKIYNILQ